MSDDNDLVKGISETQAIRIAERRGSAHQKPQDQKHQSKQKKKNFIKQSEFSINDDENHIAEWIHYNMELGRLIIEKKNIELTLYTRIEDEINQKEEEKKSTDFEVIIKEKKLQLIKKQIIEIEQRISELSPDEFSESSNDETVVDVQLRKLLKIKQLYRQYEIKTEAEEQTISEEDLAGLKQLMDEKSFLLNQISKIQNSVVYSVLRELEEKSLKKIKANEFLSDIHTKMTSIIDLENKNSVELQNQKKEVQLRLEKRNAGVRAISLYANAKNKSHFIDTTK